MPKIAIPWWKSKVIVGGALSLVATVLKATGIIGDIPDDTISQVADAVVTVVAAGGAITAVGARVTQKEAPLIVASNAGAEVITAAHEVINAAPTVAEELSASFEIGDRKLEVPSWMLR